jgi:hypothetical protein
MADDGDGAASVTVTPFPIVHEIEELDLRSVFPREDRTFTPWLSHPENFARLARTVGGDGSGMRWRGQAPRHLRRHASPADSKSGPASTQDPGAGAFDGESPVLRARSGKTRRITMSSL